MNLLIQRRETAIKDIKALLIRLLTQFDFPKHLYKRKIIKEESHTLMPQLGVLQKLRRKNKLKK